MPRVVVMIEVEDLEAYPRIPVSPAQPRRWSTTRSTATP